MRCRLILFFIGVFLLQGACLLGQENETRTSQIITVSDYSAFLEEVASAPEEKIFSSLPIEVVALHDLGDQKMVNSLRTTSALMRSGKPGSYYYEIVISEPEAPVPFLSWDDAVCYSAWKNALHEKESGADEVWEVEVKNGNAAIDHSLRSNMFIFQITYHEILAHEAVGAEIMSSYLNQLYEILEAIAFGVSAIPPPESSEISHLDSQDILSRSGEHPEGRTSLHAANQEITLVGQQKSAESFEKENESQVHTPITLEPVVPSHSNLLETHQRTIAEAINKVKNGAKERERRVIRSIQDFDKRLEIIRTSFVAEVAKTSIQIEKLKRLASESKTKADTSSGFLQSVYQQSSNCFNEAIEYFNNAITAISSSNAESATLWKEGAREAKKAAEKYQESAQKWLRGSKNQARYLDSITDSFLVEMKSKKCLAKEREAKVSRELKLAQQWRDVAEQNQQASEHFVRSADAYFEGKEKEAANWNRVGRGFYDAAEKLREGIEAEKARDLTVAQAWYNAAEEASQVAWYLVRDS